MSGVNKVIILGHLGRDPETRYTNAGGAVANISVATSDVWNDKNTGERKERSEWHNVVAFNRLAEVAGEYLRKGSKVYIEGKLQTDKYEKEGVQHYSTKVICQQLQMLDSRPDSRPAGNQPANPRHHAKPPVEDFNDEIPF